MGWLAGLPLGIFRLLFGLVMLAVRLAVPLLILVVVIVLIRRARRQRSWQNGPQEPQEPHFDGPVYTVDYREDDEEA